MGIIDLMVNIKGAMHRQQWLYLHGYRKFLSLLINSYISFVFLSDSHLLTIHLQTSSLIILASSHHFLTRNFLPCLHSLQSTATEIIKCFSSGDWHAHYKT